MAINTPQKVGMPLGEFMRLQDEQPYELLMGEKIDKVPSPLIHSWVIRMAILRLYAFFTQHGLGEMFQETSYAEITEDQSCVKGARISDVMFLSNDRVQQHTRAPGFSVMLPLGITPDLVVEVLSPSDKAVDINRKVMVD